MRRSLTAFIIGLSCVGLTWGCAELQYQPKLAGQGGYSHSQLATNVFDVHYNGSGRFDPERIQDFLLLRSAELCLDAGFAYFEHVQPPRQPALNYSGGFFPDLPTAPTFVRVQCFKQPSQQVTKRLDCGFIETRLRQKYALAR